MTKIMLVEDDKSLREIYGVRLLAEGYEITSAGDGEEALAMAVKERPDLIVSDVMMPKISGFDMLDILRTTPETKDIKIIMMTALSSEDQRTRGETLGANRYLVKSQVGIEDVVRTVHEVLADSPTVAAPVNQDFGAPAPSDISNPQPFNLPAQPMDIPTPELVADPAQEPATATEPVLAPGPVPEPTPAPVTFNVPVQQLQEPAEPTAIVAPTAPEPVTEMQLPQPTAPFSTAAPSSLGDATANSAQPTVEPATEPEPIAAPEPAITPDMGTLIDQEINDGSDTAQGPNQTPPQNTPFIAP
jgi:CheY-like chemotaxis protein